jgi:hypothetical protein
LDRLPAIYVADSFIVPSVRRGDLTIQHTIVNTTDASAPLWLIDRSVDADGEIGLETPAEKLTVPAHAQATVVVVASWANPRLWSPVDPHLYTLRTLVMDQSGEPLDLREDRFGFREMWIDGGHFMFNGARVNLLGDSIEDHSQRPRYWAQQYFDCSTARDTLQRIKALNINAVRFHQSPPADCVLDAADELGLLVIAESAVYARIDILPPFNRSEQYVANAETWIGDWVRRRRNHPSIVMWSLENEMFLYGFALGMNQVFPLRLPAQEADSISRPDEVRTAARPVNWDGDSAFLWYWFPADPPTVNWHYPNNRYFTIAPDREWYDDALAHFEPYLIEAVPSGVGETMVDRRDPWGEHTPDQVKAMQGIAVRAMRILGFSDMRPYHLSWAWHFFYPDGTEHPFALYYHSLYTQEEKDRLVKVIRESYHPIAVFDREYTRTPANLDGTLGRVPLPASATVQRTLVALNDSFLPGRAQTISWSVVDEATGDTLAAGEFETQVELGGSEERTIAFDTPAVDAPHALTLHLRSQMDGLPQGEFTTEYSFLAGD